MMFLFSSISKSRAMLRLTAALYLTVAAAAASGQDSAERSQRLLQRIDLDSNGLISRSENDVHALREFNTMDRDGNGLVGPRGRNSARRGGLRPAAYGAGAADASRSLENRVMRRLDGNADGLLDREEMLAVARERFRRIDADGDGQISIAEIQFDIEAQARRRQRERFRSADTDGDGVLSPREFERLRGGIR